MPTDEAVMNQLALGLEEKRKGQRKIAAKNPRFVEIMRRTAHGISRLKGFVTVEDLHPIAERSGMKPTHPNAWGPVFAHGFERIGYRVSERTDRKGGIISVWRSKLAESTYEINQKPSGFSWPNLDDPDHLPSEPIPCDWCGKIIENPRRSKNPKFDQKHCSRYCNSKAYERDHPRLK